MGNESHKKWDNVNIYAAYVCLYGEIKMIRMYIRVKCFVLATYLCISGPFICSVLGIETTYPGAAWEFKTPAELGLDATNLNIFSSYITGRGCVVRYGYMAHTWGSQSFSKDIASAAKPCYNHFLFKAIDLGILSNLNEKLVDWQSCLYDLNAALGYKDRNISFYHTANQLSCYGVTEDPGTAFDYNDYQIALHWDTIFLSLYGATYENVDDTVLHPLLTDPLQCQDNPTFMAFGTGTKPGRMAMSVRDHARFGLLYLNKGNWNGTQLISEQYATLAVSSPVPSSMPRTAGVDAEMCPGQRTLGGTKNQSDHHGSYSYGWWINGVDSSGNRLWPDAPHDTYIASGHWGIRCLWIMPSLQLIVAYNYGSPTNNAEINQAMLLLLQAVTGWPPDQVTNPNPSNQEINVSTTTDLSWAVAGGATSYDVYFGDTNPPPFQVNQPETIFDTGTMNQGQTYHWRIDSRNEHGVTQGIDWSFTTSFMADLDGDTDVDMDDFTILQDCATGPAMPLTDPNCHNADLDGDDDVDQNDFGIFQKCMGGPNQPSAC